MEGKFENQLNARLVYDTLARILGERYGVELTVTVRPREEKIHEKKDSIP